MHLSELDEGPVETITRIEFELLGNGRFRWNLFAGAKRIHSEIARPDTQIAILKTTAIMCTYPDGEEDDEQSEGAGESEEAGR